SQLAAPEDFHQVAVRVLDETGLDQSLGVHDALRGEAAEGLEVHHRVLGLAAVRQEATLGKTPVERHLPPLEAARLAAARSRVVALVALGRRLAVAGARSTAHTLAR